MSHCCLMWFTNFLIVIRTKLLSQAYLMPRPCPLPQPHLLTLIPTHFKLQPQERTCSSQNTPPGVYVLGKFHSFIHSTVFIDLIGTRPYAMLCLIATWPAFLPRQFILPSSFYFSSSLRNLLWTTQIEWGAPLLYSLYGGQWGEKGTCLPLLLPLDSEGRNTILLRHSEWLKAWAILEDK